MGEAEIYQIPPYQDHLVGQVALKMIGTRRVKIFTGKGTTYVPVLGDLDPGNHVTIEVFPGIVVTIENKIEVESSAVMTDEEFVDHVYRHHRLDVTGLWSHARDRHRHVHKTFPQDHDHDAW